MIRWKAFTWLAAAALWGTAASVPVLSHAASAAAGSDRLAATVDTAPMRPPDAISLFSGKPEELQSQWVMRDTDQPAAWKIEDGVMTSSRRDIATKQEFGDFYLHLEFKEPYMPNARGQERGNSGIGLQGRYEIQVLDSYGIADPGTGDCGAVYSQAAPLVNACKPPLQWQAYDIVFRAPRLNDAGSVIEKPRVTVLQNGMVVQNNQEIMGPTGIQSRHDRGMAKTGPIVLQYHNNSIQYRNIWVVPLPPHGAQHY